MEFKLKNLTVFADFSFFASLVIGISLSKLALYFQVVYFAFFHECAHAFLIRFFGSRIKRLTLTAFGARMVTEPFSNVEPIKKCLIYLSGAIVNFMMAVVLTVIGKANEATLNFTLAIFNLLPFFSFDGANAVMALTEYRLSANSQKKLLILLSSITLLIALVINMYFLCSCNPQPVFLAVTGNLIVIYIVQMKRNRHNTCKK